jgi:arginase
MTFPAIGLASGIGGNLPGCGQGPVFLKETFSHLEWLGLIEPEGSIVDKAEAIAKTNEKLAALSRELAGQGRFFFSFGGDHSSAIGMWSGVAHALRKAGDLGLLWIDAHMDAHTFETTETGNIHGMPLAALMGYGEKKLTQISDLLPKVKPEHIALVGIRNYEKGEAELIKKLNVRTYFMEEVKERGVKEVMPEALNIVSQGTAGYGISFDLDSIDPEYIKAVGTPVAGGIHPDEMLSFFSTLNKNPPLAFEFVEYNPSLDPQLESARFIQSAIETLRKVCPLKIRRGRGSGGRG